ncbi:MAG: hypothetical protein HYR88_16755 [Verrucomicrobia bacterium]|nr:hypothetical protein [Verrucomicrobiota bacterium]MBI3869491.1 hypothetical protein [Verrucomicrobiota bacterium]
MRDLFFKHFWLKLTSLVLATLIWLTVQATLEKENRQVYQSEETADELFRRAKVPRQFELPVEIRWEGTNYQSLFALPAKVVVTMEGDPGRISAMDTKELTAFIETGGPPDPRGIYPVQVLAPSNLRCTHIMPHSVRLKGIAPSTPPPG